MCKTPRYMTLVIFEKLLLVVSCKLLCYYDITYFPHLKRECLFVNSFWKAYRQVSVNFPYGDVNDGFKRYYVPPYVGDFEDVARDVLYLLHVNPVTT